MLLANLNVPDCKKLLFLMMAVFTFAVFVLLPTARVIADPMTPEENKALNWWTNWVADTCSTNGNSQGSIGTGGTLSVPSDFSLSQKIGQLLMVGVTDTSTATELENKYQIGGFLLNTNGSDFPYSKDDTDKINKAGELPALFAVDEEGGQVDRLGAGIPDAKAMGNMSADQVKQYGQLVGKKMSNIGINVDFAPVLDLNNGSNEAISSPDRSFANSQDSLSDQVKTITNKAGAFADGLKQAGIVPTFKHFPGLGRATGSTNGNTDTGSASTPSLSSLEANDLKPYTSLLQSSGGQNAVMVGNQIVPDLTGGQPASLSKDTYQLLRNKYNFYNVTFTDDLSAAAIPVDLPNAVVQALEAGAVMPLFNASSVGQVDSIINAVQSAVNSGRLRQSVINNNLKNVLDLKSSGASAAVSNGENSTSGCCAGGAGVAVSGSISPLAGKGMSTNAQQKFQQYAVAAGQRNHIDPNYLVSFYYTEMGRTDDSTNNADAAQSPPVTGDGKWIEPAPPVGHGDSYVTNDLGYSEPMGLDDFDKNAYGEDGDGDGRIDVLNLADALFTAAKYLYDHGARANSSNAKLKEVALAYNATDAYAQSVMNTYNYLKSGGGISVAGGGCAGGTTVDCSGSTGTEKILCAAKAYQGIYYEFGGGHQGYSAFKQGCPDPSNPPNNQPHGGPVNGDPAGLSGNPSPCGLDCSSLVSVAVDDAFGQSYMWSVAGSMQGAGADNWHSIPMNQAKAGDIVTSSGHVEIVDHVSGGTVYTFGAHNTGEKIGPTSFDTSYFTGGAWRWTGPGV